MAQRNEPEGLDKFNRISLEPDKQAAFYKTKVATEFGACPDDMPIAGVVENIAKSAYKDGVGLPELLAMIASTETKAAFNPQLAHTIAKAFDQASAALRVNDYSLDADATLDSHRMAEEIDRVAFQIEEGRSVFEFITNLTGGDKRGKVTIPLVELRDFIDGPHGRRIMLNAVIRAAQNCARRVYEQHASDRGLLSEHSKLYSDRINPYVGPGSLTAEQNVFLIVQNLFSQRVPIDIITTQLSNITADPKIIDRAVAASAELEVDNDRDRYRDRLHRGCMDIADTTPITQFAGLIARSAVQTSFLTFKDVNELFDEPQLQRTLAFRTRELMRTFSSDTGPTLDSVASVDETQPVEAFVADMQLPKRMEAISRGSTTVSNELTAIFDAAAEREVSNRILLQVLERDEVVNGFAQALRMAMKASASQIFQRELHIRQGFLVQPSFLALNVAPSVLKLRVLSHPQGPLYGLKFLIETLEQLRVVDGAQIQYYIETLLGGKEMAIGREQVEIRTLIRAAGGIRT